MQCVCVVLFVVFDTCGLWRVPFVYKWAPSLRKLRHDLREEWGSMMLATSGDQLQSNVSLLWKMASVGKWEVWCCVFFVLLRVIKTENILSDRAGKPEIFSSLVYGIILHHKVNNYVSICMFRPAPEVYCSTYT